MHTFLLWQWFPVGFQLHKLDIAWTWNAAFVQFFGSLGPALVQFLCHAEASNSNTANPAQNTSWSHQCRQSSYMEILFMVWTNKREINGKKPSCERGQTHRWVLFMCYRVAQSNGVFMLPLSSWLSFNLKHYWTVETTFQKILHLQYFRHREPALLGFSLNLFVWLCLQLVF